MMALFPEHSAAFIFRPRWFIVNRFIAVAGVAGAILAARFVFGIDGIHYRMLWLLAGILLLSNLAYGAFHLFGPPSPGADFAARNRLVTFTAIQVTVDLVLLTLMLHYSGGAANPFVLYYFFHTILASILLTKPLAYIEAAAAAALFVSMTVCEGIGILPHYYLMKHDVHRDPVFITGISAALVTALFIAVYMAESIMDRLRTHQNELERALAETARLETEKSRFLDIVAHDLKSPLAAIESMVTSTLAVYGDGMVPKVRETLERIPVRTRESIAFIRELLEFSRMRSTDAIALEREPVDVNSIARSTMELYGDEAALKGISMTFHGGTSARFVHGNGEMLSRLIGNLVSNAVRYTPDGGEVTVTVDERGRDVIIEVRDSGIGIPVEDIDHVFGDFYRAPNARKYNKSGTGLGLSIVRSVAAAHGGSVNVRSEPGRGAVFTAYIPSYMGERRIS